MTANREELVERLLPCPFCGKVPSVVVPDNSYGSALITCGDGNECPVDLAAWGDLKAGETLQTAAAAWNTRAAIAELTQGSRRMTVLELAARLEACAEDAKRPEPVPGLGDTVMRNQPASVISLANAIEAIARELRARFSGEQQQ